MKRRQTLENALATAEANLQRAVTMLAAVGADQATASDELERARAKCRQAHAAIAEFDNAER